MYRSHDLRFYAAGSNDSDLVERVKILSSCHPASCRGKLGVTIGFETPQRKLCEFSHDALLQLACPPRTRGGVYEIRPKTGRLGLCIVSAVCAGDRHRHFVPDQPDLWPTD